MTRWLATLRLRATASSRRRQRWLERASRVSLLMTCGAITDRHAERLMAELGECP